ncbi:MAG: hypothetical protein V1774_00060 [Candidatus Eisenbacteria bacterium]
MAERWPSWFRRGDGTGLLVAGVAIALLSVIGLPMLSSRKEPPGNPAADAEAAYHALLARVGSPQPPAGPADGGQAEGTGEGAPADSAVHAAPAGTWEQGDAHLVRDLFSPAPQSAPPREVRTTPAPRGPARPPLPRLTGILIDGPSRQAVLNGRRLSIGDAIGEYRIVSIEAGRVRVRHGESDFTIEVQNR